MLSDLHILHIFALPFNQEIQIKSGRLLDFRLKIRSLLLKLGVLACLEIC